MPVLIRCNPVRSRYTPPDGRWKILWRQVKTYTQLIARSAILTLEQADGLSSLTRAVDELNLITQKNAELVEESAQVSAMVKHRAADWKTR